MNYGKSKNPKTVKINCVKTNKFTESFDLKRVLKVVEYFKIPYGIVINKYNLNKDFSKKIELLAKKSNIKILEKIPYNRKFVDALVNLTPIIEYDKKTEKFFKNIINKI